MTTVLRYWLAASVALLAVWAMWVFAPVMFFIVMVTAALALVSGVMIVLARALRARLGRD